MLSDVVILRVPSDSEWHPVIMLDDFKKVVSIDLGSARFFRGNDGLQYVTGLRPCSAIYVKYSSSFCNSSNCPCDSSQYQTDTNCDYSVGGHLDFVRANGWSLWKSRGCFGASTGNECVNKFSDLDGVGGMVSISIPESVLGDSNLWVLVICFDVVEYVFTGVFETIIVVEPSSAGCTVSYEFIKPDNSIGESGVVESNAYIYSYAGTYYSKLKLTPHPSQNYNFVKFGYKWGSVTDTWSEGDLNDLPCTDNECVIQFGNVSTSSILFIKAYFEPVHVEVNTADFPIKQGMHLFGGWNLSYLEIINSNVEFHFGVSSFSNLPIGSYMSSYTTYLRNQEVLTPILVRRKYGLSEFGSIARIKNSSLTFYIPHPLKFYDVYSGVGVYGSCINNVSTNFADGSYISGNLNNNKHLMSLITFVLDDPTGSASKSIEFSGCSIKVIKNACSTNNTTWPHVSYFTLIRKFTGAASSTLKALDYIILPSMFRDNVLTGFFYEEPQGQSGNSALFAAFTGFQFILDDSSKFFFFDLGSVDNTAEADSLEGLYFVYMNKSINVITSISYSGCSGSSQIIIPESGNTDISFEEEI